MPDQTIKPVSPVAKTKNTLQNKKPAKKKSHPEKKAVEEKPPSKKNGIDTYA